MAFAENRKINFDYETLESFEAGIELTGLEVKSLRTHTSSLEGAYVTVRGGEAYLMNMNVPPYQASNTPKEYDPLRTRRLLLSKKEIRKLADIEAGKGLTIVPVKVYNKNRVIKVQVSVVRGKKQFDKRQTTLKRETDRSARRTLKYGQE